MNTAELQNELVGKIVSRLPQLAKVFEKYQLDYCCRGNARLADACREKNVDVSQVLSEIDTAMQTQRMSRETDWNSKSLTELADHIVNTHHRFMREELPRIDDLIQKVVNAHGAKHPELQQIGQVYRAMRAELESHMAKEENVLFPAVRKLEAAPETCHFAFGSVDNPIRMMRHEHEDVGNSLQSLRELTGDFTPPKDACPTFRVMFESLTRLEQDLHIHIHKENNILFPRAQELEQTVAAG